jgi:hypothetical protein
MAKYLLQISYTADGAKGLLKDGGTKRRAVGARRSSGTHDRYVTVTTLSVSV